MKIMRKRGVLFIQNAPFLCYHLRKRRCNRHMYTREVIISRLRAVGNSDNAEDIYNIYAKNGDIETLVEYLDLKECERKWEDSNV